jgi:hypothetical protein
MVTVPFNIYRYYVLLIWFFLDSLHKQVLQKKILFYINLHI